MSMNILVVYAHPNAASFNYAVLNAFTEGAEDAGHALEVVDLHAIGFDPVYRLRDYAFWVNETVPPEQLARMNLKQQVLDSCTGFLQRTMARVWLWHKEDSDIIRLMKRSRPKDVLEQQKKVAWAQGIVFIAPIFWMHYPAILKGWIERVFTFGFAWGLEQKAYQGDISGRVPLLQIKKALSITTTGWRQEDYQSTGCHDAMRLLIDVYGLEYPGIPDVRHEYFYAVWAASDQERREYLDRAYQLGNEF